MLDADRLHELALSARPPSWECPDRLLLSLGRVAYFAAAVDSVLTEALVECGDGPNGAVGVIVVGESSDWKLQKLKAVILASADSATGMVELARQYIAARIPNIKELYRERNILVHSTWNGWHGSESDFTVTRERRSRRDVEERACTIHQIESLADRFEQEYRALGCFVDVLIHVRVPNLEQSLHDALQDSRLTVIEPND